MGTKGVRTEQCEKKDILLIFNNKVYFIKNYLLNTITEKWRFHVVSKKRIYGDYSLLEEKRKRYRNHLIVYLLVFIPCVLALIGFNVLLLYASTNFFLALLVAVFGQYVFLINFFLIVFDSLLGLFVILSTRGFISTKRKINRFEYASPRTENKILQFLIDNKEESFSSASISDQINYQGISEEFEAILIHLVEDRKINKSLKEEAPNYSINL